MVKINSWQTTTALLVALNLSSATIIPLVTPFVQQGTAMAQTSKFADVQPTYWATNFINPLVERGIIAGFPDGTFQPDAPVTRAQFAAMVTKAFPKTPIRNSVNFTDVSSTYWAKEAIDAAYGTGFLSGYPGGVFNPNQNIPREQVLVSLANGLNYTSSGNIDNLISTYTDSALISPFARPPIASATQQQLVVNYPLLNQLNPTRSTTRAEVAAFIYQALVSQSKAPTISSQYIVSLQPTARSSTLLAGSRIPVSYEKEKILLTKEEKLNLTLTAAQDVRGIEEKVIIPKGSQISGQLQPIGGGTEFVAQRLTFPDGTIDGITASSAIVTTTETVRRGTSAGIYLRNAAIGTAGAAAIAAITGDKAIATEELLIGTGAGVLGTLIPDFLGWNQIELLSIKPATDLELTLDRDLVIPQ